MATVEFLLTPIAKPPLFPKNVPYHARFPEVLRADLGPCHADVSTGIYGKRGGPPWTVIVVTRPRHTELEGFLLTKQTSTKRESRQISHPMPQRCPLARGRSVAPCRGTKVLIQASVGAAALAKSARTSSRERRKLFDNSAQGTALVRRRSPPRWVPTCQVPGYFIVSRCRSDKSSGEQPCVTPTGESL